MPNTFEQIEDFLEDMFASLEQMPDTLTQLTTQLWHDITRYGPPIPSFPEVHLPSGLGDFVVPPPPPPPPVLPPPSWAERVKRHPGVVMGVLGGGAVGIGLISYGSVYMRARRARILKEKIKERRQVVVVLGADAPLALPLILDLERKGYIVIASVSRAELGENLERRCKGYVRALVLDPNEPHAAPNFLRSLTSTLSRKFPINAGGDPFVSSAAQPYIHSVISLLSLSPAPFAPLEHISLPNTYLPYLQATHTVPLQVIQGILPLLRTGSSPPHEKRTIIVCLPATWTRVGLPFSAMQSMSAVSTLRAVEVLRREVRIAALTDKSQAMRNIKVVAVDVGAFNFGAVDTFLPPNEVYGAMKHWSSSEKLTYGPSFASLSHAIADLPAKSRWSVVSSDVQTYGISRKATDVSVFVDSIVGTVSGGRLGSSLGLGRFWYWMRGDRFSVGAGASTYKFASFLPPLLLDGLISIPHLLVEIRNALLPVQPFIRPPPTLPLVQQQQQPLTSESELSGTDLSGAELSETGSEADVESNSGDGASWVDLTRSQAQL